MADLPSADAIRIAHEAVMRCIVESMPNERQEMFKYSFERLMSRGSPSEMNPDVQNELRRIWDSWHI